MLIGLSITDFVLVDRLRVDFGSGLNVLTGETGAGKSILLDALGLALGARGGAGLVRLGAEQAVVSAEFEAAPGHPAHALLAEQGLSALGEEPDRILLRRIITPDGRSRAFVNDQPASVGLLRQLGETLVEIHGQFETQGLLDPAGHLGLLDSFGGHGKKLADTAECWRLWREAEAARARSAAEREAAAREEGFLRHAVEELDALAPEEGEAARLASEREILRNREALLAALGAAEEMLGGEEGADRRMQSALARLEPMDGKSGGRLSPIVSGLDRASAELREALSELRDLGAEIEGDGAPLEEIESRLFALKALARKHGVAEDDLPRLRDDLARQLSLIEDRGGLEQRLAAAAEAAKKAYAAAAETLSKARAKSAKALDKAVKAELPPLKLDKADFVTDLSPLAEERWGERGRDRAQFLVAPNPGAPAGPLDRIASGGELARFMLALKLVLAKEDSVPSLIFDEVDTGIGGATAAAIGERLARLGRDHQILAVTHSPQVAARGNRHWRVEKTDSLTRLRPLDEAERREEIARMISGAVITDEARAQAAHLLRSA
jgi:DNA repair protein RecN (Recombination protein N)